MLLPPRARPGYWPRTFPRTLVKTCVLALGVLLWVMYFYSASSFSYDKRPPGGSSGDSKRAEGFILRRPTVPLFEGAFEGDGSTAVDDPVVVPAPSGGSGPKVSPSDGPKTTVTPPEVPGAVRRGGYLILENLLESRLRFGYNQSVTITTHATYELLDNLIYLSRRWKGPISVAVYAPREDFKTALTYALWLRRCHPTVRDYVTFHFVYPAPPGETNVQGAPMPSPNSALRNPAEMSSKASLLSLQLSSEAFRKSLESGSTAVRNSTGASKQFLESDSVSESLTNSSKTLQSVQEWSSRTLENLSESSKSLQSSEVVSQKTLNLPESLKEAQKPAEASTALRSSRDFSPKTLKNQSDLSKTVQKPTGASTALQSSGDTSPRNLKNSSQSSKTVQKMAGASTADTSPKTLKHLPEDPALFDGSLPGYEHLARDIIRSHSSASEAPAQSCNSTSFPLPRSYRHRHGLPYPINVCRNVARLNAKTHFVLASDIELYPSADVIVAFLDFSRRTGLVQRPGWEATERSPASSLASFFLRGPAAASTHPVRRVYVLPIFEVDRSVAAVPATKATLVDLYRRKKAVYFHKHVCSFCNIIPRLNRWLVSPAPKGRNNLGIFMSIKRHKPFNRWEPIYIGTNSEPLYDERLTWEGQQDKMTQMYELCLMNYDLAILDNAFLVHRPGIKTKNATEYKLKSPFIAQNNKIYKTIITDLEKKHGTNSWCK